MKKPEQKHIEIALAIYRCSVIVTWEQDIDKVIKWAQKQGVKISDDWKGEFTECRKKATGTTLMLGDENTDILVWLKVRPKKASEYGVLYHELYHATDRIAEDHNLKEGEARAYIFEFLANECNRVLWK